MILRNKRTLTASTRVLALVPLICLPFQIPCSCLIKACFHTHKRKRVIIMRKNRLTVSGSGQAQTYCIYLDGSGQARVGLGYFTVGRFFFGFENSLIVSTNVHIWQIT